MLTLQSGCLLAQENYPFPQNIDYLGIQPNNHTTVQQNNDVKAFYDYWKGRYLKPATTGGYYVHGADTDGLGKGTSESHGYGMVLTALMAGHDPDAKQEFDGLFNFFDSHRSVLNPYLMGWFINATESGTGTYSSATDGDMDIAYALLLADKQWGSTGTIDYKNEAIDMINNGLRIGDYSSNSKRLMLGDWDSNALTTRSSDWMPGHLRAFEHVTGDQEWLAGINEIYTMVDQINATTTTGLMPDFVTGVIAGPDLGNANGTGELHAGDYFYNAARTPLRIAIDYIHNGNLSAKAASDKLTSWAKLQVGNNYNFNQYFSGYTIQGTALAGSNYSSTVFVAPVVIAASVDSANQAFVNAGWNYMRTTQESYFEDSVNLLSMLAITGNWWAPNHIEGQGGGDNGNGIPVAVSKSISLAKNTSETVVLDGIDDGTVVSFNIESNPVHGTVSLQGNQATYAAGSDYIGTDSFTYTVLDNDGLISLPATVSVTVVDNIIPTLVCSITENVWSSGFSANITVTNNTAYTISNWQVLLNLGNGEQISSYWSSTMDTSVSPVIVGALSWNNVIAAGASVQIGAVGTHNGSHLPLTCQ